ncbi:receptor-type tyrosine-protein phosphatase eta [Leuresthes tenuis]|uniref:receptor-type tyrosine-protein phosphatase eta n=1 Tax=Leuresthes tenuis TaxID=355514 RepID=UPI003B50F680
MNLTVTEITTSSISLSWIKPLEQSSFYKVQWTDGNITGSSSQSETNINITNLTAGVQYQITVTAVAGDGHTEGQNTAVSKYTQPEEVRDLTVTGVTTSSLFVNWTKPKGNSSFYRVQWTGGEISGSVNVSDTFKSITNLTAGVQYQITVTAVAGDGHTEGQNTAVSKYTQPEVIMNLTVTEITTSSISLSWIKPLGQSSFYKVQWTDGNITGSSSQSETNITISNLTAGVQYEIDVTSVAGDNETKGKATAVSVYTKPEEVRGLTVTGVTTSSLFVNWTKPKGNSSFYRVQWTGGEISGSVNVSDTFKSITNLTAGVQYQITVTAVAGDGHTEGQNTAVSKYTQPDVVMDLTVTEITTSSISLSWIKPLGQSSFYKVQWTDGNITRSSSQSETNITISNLTAGVQYEIDVTSVAGDNETKGKATAVSVYTKPEEVRDLTVTGVTTSSLFVNWTKPKGNSSFYRVQWTGREISGSVNVSDTFKSITNLTAGVQYQITVTAVAGDGHTEGQNTTVSKYTQPEVIMDLTVTEITTSSISLSWIKPLGQSSFYKVQWTDGNITGSSSQSETNITISNLTAGVQYEIDVTAVAGDNETKGKATAVSVYTKPEEVRGLTVTGVTTSSLFVNWTKPKGNSSFYRVQWTGREISGSVNVSDTFKSITNLTAGVQYQITVTAVAGDGHTEGQNTTVSKYTQPEVVMDLTVTEITTSSISLNWIKPLEQSSFYKVQWTDGNITGSSIQSETNINITNLTAGVQYQITVTAVAGDGHTEGQNTAVSKYTRPGAIQTPSFTTNTTAIFLNWFPPPGQVFSYKVDWRKHEDSWVSKHVKDTSTTLSNLTPGTCYTVNITAIAGDNKTEGDTHTFNQVTTRPDGVVNLIVVDVATSSVSLNWNKPQGNADIYKIQWNSTNHGSNNGNTSETSYTINGLVPGVLYNITVTAFVALGSVEGKPVFDSTFTRPEKPGNIASAQGTDNLQINWTLPEGEAVRYIVNISNADLGYVNHTITSLLTAHFTDLHPGRLYAVTVTAEAGSFSNTSDEHSFATVPTPPGAITISHRTNSSLRLEWTTPLNMNGAPDIKYNITYTKADGNTESKESQGNSAQLDLNNLESGTFYNITINTVGPQDLKSVAVRNSSVTLPNPVWNVVASPTSTTSIKVTWSAPPGTKDYYRYLIQTYNASGLVNQQTVNSNSTDVSNLEPGSKYDINVTVTVTDDTVSTAVSTFSYTRPKAVTNLSGVYVNTTAINLSWDRQSDHKPSYTYWVNVFLGSQMVQNGSTEEESITFYNLRPGTPYTFNVYTVIERVFSANRSKEIYTIPERVSNIIAIGTTTSLTVSWTEPEGLVSSYSVSLYNNTLFSQSLKVTNLSKDDRNTTFEDLKPGVLYCVELVTISGPVKSNRTTSCNATFPNPPGSITVAFQTVNSINFTWQHPENMDHNQYNFSVSAADISNLTENNWFLLENLQSGSPYSISVVTVGVLGFTSTAVTVEKETRPYPVRNLASTEITTNSVTLVWEQQEKKPSYSYEVLVNGSRTTETTTNVTVRGLWSGSNFSVTITTLTANGTRSEPVTVSYFTRPYNITELEAETLNTSAIHLNWRQPLEYKNEYIYLVQTTGCGSLNKTVEEENTDISGLTPGTNCAICVSVRAANGIEGEKYCISQYTKPEKVEPSISSQGSNSSVWLSWTKPAGNVELYKLHLNSSSKSFNKVIELNSASDSFLLNDLYAGVLYSVMLSTCSGPFNVSSGFVTNATFPNPPGLIEILRKTINSIEFRWDEAPLMAGSSFHYLLMYTHTQGENNTAILGTNTRYTFTSLLSGTPYSIFVRSIGPMNFESESVHIMVTTRPESVRSLAINPQENKITVLWTEPVDNKSSYRYNVTWQSSNDRVIRSNISYKTSYIIDDLTSGTMYNISVTTETSDGTEGASERVNNCTDASPVANLTCDGPNSANAEVILSWTKPPGGSAGFQITQDGKAVGSMVNCCEFNVSNLNHFKEYDLAVITQSCGHSSVPVSRKCMTGITRPPIPRDFKNLSVTTNITYTKFSIQLDRDLLDNSNGPIKYVGVLVKRDILDESDSSNYLEKTYDEWKANSAKAYLATVINNTFQSRSSHEHLEIDIANGSTWNGYTNGALNPGETYRYAFVFFTSLERMENNRVNSKLSLFSVTEFYWKVKLQADPAIIAIAIGATLGIFGFLFVILMGFIIYWKRLAKKEESDIQIHSLRSAAVRVEDYEAYYKKQKADSNCGFAEEFEDLKPVGTSQAKIHALTLENKPKNRYNNVLPYDSSRVKLSIIHGSPYDDYINANYMPGYLSRKEFIAAQGPLPTTVNEFWRMIWEKNILTLVMLTRCNEQGRVKCEQYWSPGTKHFEDITVTTTSEIPLDDWTIRDFDVKNMKTAEVRSVRHFHFTAWPDHGVPETTELLISFRHLVREHMNQYSRNSPTMVHCSAGVGRTGTFIAIDRLIFQIERENIVDVYGIVYDLRMHRPLMVQTEDQYVFLNQCALDVIRSRTGTNVDLIYQNTAALSIYENVEPKKRFS